MVSAGGGAIAVIAVAALGALGAAVGVRWAFVSLRDRQGTRASHDTRGARDTRTVRDPRARIVDRSDDGTAAALLLVMSVAAVLLWIANPFAAALMVPALHLWLWAIDSDLRIVLPGAVRAADRRDAAGRRTGRLLQPLARLWPRRPGLGGGAVAGRPRRLAVGGAACGR